MPPHADVIKVLQEESIKPNVHGYQNYKKVHLFCAVNFYQIGINNGIKLSLMLKPEILPLIGIKEGIMHICMTYFEEGTAVLVPNPGYPTYASASKAFRGAHTFIL